MINRIASLFILLAAVSLMAAACAGIPKPAARGPKRFVLLATNGTAGALEAQGCACRRLGGMARRAGCIARARVAGPPVLVLDSGNLLFAHGGDPGPQERQAARVLLDCISRMQTTAVNVSARDCAAGADFLQKSSAGPALVSANLRDSTTGELLFAPFLTRSVNRARIGIFGLTGPDTMPEGPGIRVDDPLSSARKAVGALQRAGCDVVVLLSQLTDEQNRQLLAQVPGIHFVLGSSEAQPGGEPIRCADAHIISPGQHGTHAALVDCTLEGSGPVFVHAGETPFEKPGAAPTPSGPQTARGRFTLVIRALGSDVPADPDIELLVENFRAERAGRRLQADGVRYLEAVPGIDMRGLDETDRKRAVRLMNELSCTNSTIALRAADTQLCRDMGRVVVEGVRAGLSDGAVQFRVVRETQARLRARDIPLDKPSVR